MQEYSQPQSPLVERALDHPTRRSILDLLVGAQGLGLGSLAEKLEVKVANVAYHVDVLIACDVVEVVPGRRRGERRIRLPQASSPQYGKNSLDVSGSKRDDITEAQLKSLIEMAAHLRPGHAPGTS
jgi:DNA-binding transcriptional ArsR family regulator